MNRELGWGSISTSPGLPGTCSLEEWQEAPGMLEVVSATWREAKAVSTIGNVLPVCCCNLCLPRAPSCLGSNREEMPHVSCSRGPQWPQVVSKENFKHEPAGLPAAEPSPELKECVTKLPKVWHLAALPAAFHYFPSSPQSICDVSKGHS